MMTINAYEFWDVSINFNLMLKFGDVGPGVVKIIATPQHRVKLADIVRR